MKAFVRFTGPTSFLWLLCAVAGYWGLLIHQLGAQWSAYEQYNYGWVVPFLCGYLLWQRLSNPFLGEASADNGQPTTDFGFRPPSAIVYLRFAILGRR